ncbi:MAG: M20/M25/M40 family metallo-hydrolase [Acidobacteria bacterium]|nr:M20/M25/M40 family metallo-hydrolase [Acidobacteriota bacterium]
MTHLRTVLLLLLLPPRAFGQTADVAGYVRSHQPAILQEYANLLAIPNHRADLPNIRRNAALLEQMIDRRGMNGEIWETPGAPLVYGEKLVPGATRTLLFYIHYDGQPVDKRQWAQPDPFTPVLRSGSLDEQAPELADIAAHTTFPDDWRVYARSASDDKAPIVMFLSAMDAIGGTPTQNIKLILHGEEEGGGPSLDDAIEHHADKLKADLLVILDGPQHASGRPTIFYGARGGARLELTVYTARSAMHSGNYGNWLPDANVRLAQLLASMVNPTGKVAIDGFYDDVLPFPEAAVAMMKQVPDETPAMMMRFGLGSTDGAASYMQEGLNLPTFSIHQMSGGEVGGVIAARATAEIAMRLVKENSPRAMVDRVVAHIEKQGYVVVDADPDVATLAAHARIAKVTSNAGAASGAWRTDPDNPSAKYVTDALMAKYGTDGIVRLRTLGGGLPATPFINGLQLPVVGISLVNFDNNQHTDNENLRLGHLWKGIETVAAILDY